MMPSLYIYTLRLFFVLMKLHIYYLVKEKLVYMCLDVGMGFWSICVGGWIWEDAFCRVVVSDLLESLCLYVCKVLFV
jgi:hypothetical protein